MYGLLIEDGKTAEADELAAAWLKDHASDVTAAALLAEIDRTARRYESAARRYKLVLAKQSNNVVMLNNLAWVAAQLKDPKATDYAEQAYKLAPDNAAVLDTLGWILVERQEFGRASELLQRAVRLAPGAAELRLHLAKALIGAGRKPDARKELEVLAGQATPAAIQQEAKQLLSTL